VLNCLQPLLTKEFLKIGFAPKTHTTQPTLIQEAIAANNGNDMQVVCSYYGNHQWLVEIPSSLSKLPSLVMHGVDDGVIPIHHGQRVANQFQNKDLISIQDASHMILLERPQVVADHIVSFFNRDGK
jgi:pimeloyl-ACP methyl ester carboxylesterase